MPAGATQGPKRRTLHLLAPLAGTQQLGGKLGQRKGNKEGAIEVPRFSQRMLHLPDLLQSSAQPEDVAFHPLSLFGLSLELDSELSIWAHQDAGLKLSAGGPELQAPDRGLITCPVRAEGLTCSSSPR